MDLTTIAIIMAVVCGCVFVVGVVAAVIYWILKNSKREPTLK